MNFLHTFASSLRFVRKKKSTSCPLAVGGQFLFLKWKDDEFRCVEDVDAQNNDDAEAEYVFDLFAFDAFEEAGADEAADDAACDDVGEHRQFEACEAGCYLCCQEGGQLGEEDDEDGVDAGVLEAHGEADCQDCDVEWTATDAKECGDDAQGESDHEYVSCVCDVVCFDDMFVFCI